MISTTAALNGGDAAILLGECATLAHAFGEEGLEVVIFDQQADVARRYYPDLDLRPALFWLRRNGGGTAGKLRWGVRMVRLFAAGAALRVSWRRVAAGLCLRAEDRGDLEAYAGADLVLTPGGTMLVGHYKLLPRLTDFATTIALGRPLVFFTQSLGPFTRPGHRWAVGAVLRRSSLVLVRGEESRRHVLALRVPPEKVRLAPDAAFLLACEATEDRPPPRKGRPLRVAISVRDWPYFKGVSREIGQARYEQAVAELCVWLNREMGAEIVFLSTCQGIPEYWMDDSRPAARIAERLAADVRSHVSVDPDFHRPTDLRDRYRQFDVVVATRFHAAVLALCAGTPVVVIEYERKASEAFARLGLSEWVGEIGELDGTSLIEVVGRMLGRLDVLRKAVVARVADEQRQALAVADELRALLASHGRATQRSGT